LDGGDRLAKLLYRQGHRAVDLRRRGGLSRRGARARRNAGDDALGERTLHGRASGFNTGGCLAGDPLLLLPDDSDDATVGASRRDEGAASSAQHLDERLHDAALEMRGIVEIDNAAGKGADRLQIGETLLHLLTLAPERLHHALEGEGEPLHFALSRRESRGAWIGAGDAERLPPELGERVADRL